MAKIDHRVRVTKTLLRDAFTALLAQKPIQNISIRELCELAGVNRGTFYTHYQDIYALLGEMEREILLVFEQALAPLMDSFTERADPYEICLSIFRCLKEHQDMCTVLLGNHADDAFVASLLEMGRQTCVETYALHYPGASADQIEDLYAFVSAGCIGLLRRWVEGGMANTPEEVARTAALLMGKGFGYLRPEEAL